MTKAENNKEEDTATGTNEKPGCCECKFHAFSPTNQLSQKQKTKQKRAKLETMVEPTLWPKRPDNPHTESLSCTFQRPSRVYPQWTIDRRMTKKTDIFLGELCNVRFRGEEEGLVGQVLPSLQQTRKRTLDTMQGVKANSSRPPPPSLGHLNKEPAAQWRNWPILHTVASKTSVVKESDLPPLSITARSPNKHCWNACKMAEPMTDRCSSWTSSHPRTTLSHTTHKERCKTT